MGKVVVAMRLTIGLVELVGAFRSLRTSVTATADGLTGSNPL